MTEHVLREALAEEAGALSLAEDPWPAFARREARRRRTRRTRTAVVAGVLAVLAGVQTNVVPLPGWVPGVAIAAAPSPLTNGPTRGSLSGDLAWQRDLRAQVRDMQDGEGWWRVTDRDAIRVVYAGDVPGRRLALVLVPLRLGVMRDWSLFWFEGPPGAAPGRMEQTGGTDDAASPVVTWMSGGAEAGGTVVVIGPPGATVTVSGSATYAASGVLERRPLGTTTGSGVAVVAVPPSDTMPVLATRITVAGEAYFEGPVFGAWTVSDRAAQGPTAEDLAAAARDARGPALDPAVLDAFVGSAFNDSRLAARDTTVRLLWSGTVNGQPAALLTLQPRGGGVLAYAMHGTASAWRTDLRLLLPADGADRRPLAWRMRAEGKDAQTDQVVVVTPPGTATATVDGRPVALDASGAGTITVPPSRPATVTAFAADGTILASTPVPLLESDSSGLPGDSPGTRITG